MRKFEVGELFEEGKIKYQEGIKFDFDQSGAMLFLFFNHPTEDEVKNTKKGSLELRLCSMSNVIIILTKLEGMQWMDAPYSVHLSQPFEFDEIGPDQGVGLSIFLIDAATGVLKAMRYVGLSNDFSNRLKEVINEQKITDFDTRQYQQSINNIYSAYSTNEMLKYSIARCKIR